MKKMCYNYINNRGVKMKKILKALKYCFFILLIIIIIFLLFSFIYNKVMTNKEKGYLENYDIGELIDIDDYKVNYKIFNENNNENTIVLLSGHASSDLALSFEPLAKNINAKIILINRPGYAYSEDTNEEAKIDYIVDYYRKVLNKLNINDQVILMPHSVSGMYAMYWLEKYPNEIKSMIALDITPPKTYLDTPNNNFYNSLMYVGSELGFYRQTWLLNILGIDNSKYNYGYYTENDIIGMKYLLNKTPYSKFMYSEGKLIKENANIVIEKINDEYKNKPKLFIQANYISGEFYEKYFKNELISYYGVDGTNQYVMEMQNYIDEQRELLDLDNNSSFEIVSAPHNMYSYPNDKLINIINKFVTNKK